jgi:hypothetical protein
MRKSQIATIVAAVAAGTILLASLASGRPPLTGVTESIQVARLAAIPSSRTFTAVADGETATTAPNNPFTAAADANPSLDVEVGSYTGVYLRAKYQTAMGTDPVVRVWGFKGTTWIQLADLDGAVSFTLADAAATDCTDGTWLWTVPTQFIDARGSERIRVTIATAGVCAAGTIAIEAFLY